MIKMMIPKNSKKRVLKPHEVQNQLALNLLS